MKLSDVLTCPEAAELWGIAEDKIKRFAREGKFTEEEARKTGKNWLITKQGMQRVFGDQKGECAMNELLSKAELAIANEIKSIGFICDSDNTDRFLDRLAWNLAKEHILQGSYDLDAYYEHESEIEELRDQLLNEIKEKIMKVKYNKIGKCDASGNYTGYYYSKDKEFKNMSEFCRYFRLEE